MKMKIFFLILFGGLAMQAFSQEINSGPVIARNHTRKTEYIVMVAMDGMRWQEIFGGVDSSIMNDKVYTKDRREMRKAFWADDKAERRKKLMPFFWTTI